MNGYRFGVFLLLLLWSVSAAAGGACVVAKKMGNALAIEWVAGPQESGASAVKEAKLRLKEQGHHGKYVDVHPQVTSEYQHAYLVIIKSSYQTVRNKPRTSYGCGIDPRSWNDAGGMAVQNLHTYDWGWKPEHGFEIIEQTKY
jgi:hypothetical protein